MDAERIEQIKQIIRNSNEIILPQFASIVESIDMDLLRSREDALNKEIAELKTKLQNAHKNLRSLMDRPPTALIQNKEMESEQLSE